MDKQIIAKTLEDKHKDLIDWLENSKDELWIKGPEDRWTMGQHIQHLVDTLKMINKALLIPKFLIKYRYGTANRPTRSYDEVSERYLTKLKAGQERAREFNKDLRTPTLIEKHKLIKELKYEDYRLIKKLLKLSDKELDNLLLPHPLMGRMIFRELIMWTAYHTEHHFKILRRDYIS